MAIVAAAALVGSAWLVFPQWWPSWPRLVGGSQLRPDSDTIAALVVTLLGSDAIGLAPLAVVALVVLAMRFHPRGDAWLAVWLALSAAGAPYTNSYDQILVIVPIVIAAGVLHRDAPRASAAVLVVGALVLLLLTPLLYEVALWRRSETFGAIVTLSVFATVVAGLWRRRALASGASAVT